MTTAPTADSSSTNTTPADLVTAMTWPTADSYSDVVTVHRALTEHAHIHPAVSQAADHVDRLARLYSQAVTNGHANGEFRSLAQSALDHIRRALHAGVVLPAQQVYRAREDQRVAEVWMDHIALTLKR